MKQKNPYNKTLKACYIGFMTQSITANFAPLLFVTFQKSYGIPLAQIATISGTYFFTQLIVDIICSKLADRIGYRACAIASEALAALGLVSLAILPGLLPDPFTGILISVLMYAVGSGLIEVIGSPMVEACPFDNKESVQSMLHSVYCWGSAGVILLSTLFFTLFGADKWRWLSCAWAVLPLVNIFNFAVCPIRKLVSDGEGMGIRKLFRTPAFLLGILLMVCAGASELAMAQWASAFAEAALGLSKTAGNLAGPFLFAISMGISRTAYGKFGDRIKLTSFMIWSGFFCLASYILAALSRNPVLSLAGCVFCGFAVGIMWPGTISILSRNVPKGGTAMFAFLAMAGDMGGTVGPEVVGIVSDLRNGSLQAGLLAGAVFPAVLIIGVLAFRRRAEKMKS